MSSDILLHGNIGHGAGNLHRRCMDVTETVVQDTKIVLNPNIFPRHVKIANRKHTFPTKPDSPELFLMLLAKGVLDRRVIQYFLD